MSVQRVRMRLNGGPVDVSVPPERLLVDLLREDLGLTGTKIGCGVGVCGACAVLIDGLPITSCLLLAAQAEGREIRTIEGIADGDRSTALQRAFITEGGFQCGICTPGQIVTATALLERSASPADGEIRDWMKGSLCRCTGYYGILRAVRAAAEAPR